MIWVSITIFILTLLGVRLYRKMILCGIEELTVTGKPSSPIANGAGGILWDVSFVFCLYLYWYEGASALMIFTMLAITLLFTGLGLIDDFYELSPKTKLLLQVLIAIPSVIIYCTLRHFPMTFPALSLAVFFLVWLLNSINFIDILDGLASSISLVLFLTFAWLFYVHTLSPCFLLCVFWSIMLLAFLTQNLHKPSVYLGDTGAHLIGALLFFLSLEYIFQDSQIQTNLTIVFLLFLFLIADFLYVCFKRIIKRQSLFLKSNDHLTQTLLSLTASPKTTLMIMVILQLLATAACVLKQLASTTLDGF